MVGSRLAQAGALALLVIAIVTLSSLRPTETTAGQQPPAQQPIVLSVSGSGTALPIVKKLAEAYHGSHPEVQFAFESGANSGGAIRGVTQRTLNIGVTSRPLTPAEAAEAIQYVPFTRDAIAIVAREQARVSQITTQQVRTVYAGETATWSALGGPEATIVVLDRDEDESMRKLFLLPLMAGQPVTARTVILTSATDMVRALEGTANAIGYTSYGLLQIEKPKLVRTLSLDSVAPSAGAVASGAYPWSMVYGLVTHRDAHPAAVSFTEFALGPAGRAILDHYGYGTPGE